MTNTIHLRETLIGANTAAAIKDSLREGAGHPSTWSATGFDPLDRALGSGFAPRDLTLVGGLPGVGKTVVTLQWARHAARSGRAVVYACFEHDVSALLARLIMLEVGEITRRTDLAGSDQLRMMLWDVATGRRGLDELVPHNSVLEGACERLDEYAGRLWLARASGATTGPAELERMIAEHDHAALFVDYLQKIALPDHSVDNTEKVIRVVESLKEISLRRGVPVVAVVASDAPGLVARRLRLHHLRGSSALAYEADVVIMLNEKFDAVSKVHTAYDPVQAESFHRQVVFTIEKNRDGPAPLDLEFRKDFEHYRFEPSGGYVSERLIDDRFYTE